MLETNFLGFLEKYIYVLTSPVQMMLLLPHGVSARVALSGKCRREYFGVTQVTEFRGVFNYSGLTVFCYKLSTLLQSYLVPGFSLIYFQH